MPDHDQNDALLAFVQKVAGARRASCKRDHHAGTCDGAVGLAEAAARLLVSLGIEPRSESARSSFDDPCFVCGDGGYVIGQVWVARWVHAACARGGDDA